MPRFYILRTCPCSDSRSIAYQAIAAPVKILRTLSWCGTNQAGVSQTTRFPSVSLVLYPPEPDFPSWEASKTPRMSDTLCIRLIQHKGHLLPLFATVNLVYNTVSATWAMPTNLVWQHAGRPPATPALPPHWRLWSPIMTNSIPHLLSVTRSVSIRRSAALSFRLNSC